MFPGRGIASAAEGSQSKFMDKKNGTCFSGKEKMSRVKKSFGTEPGKRVQR